MINRFRNLFLFLCDALILISVTLILAGFSLRYSLSDAVGGGELLPHMVLLYICTVVFQFLFHTYDSLWRYAESREYLSLLMAAFCGFGTYEVVTRFVLKSGVISFLLLTAIAALWILGMLLIRFAYRVGRGHLQYRQGSHRISMAIVGAGSAGVQLLEEVQNNQDSPYAVQCFFDDDPAKQGRRVRGVPVKGRIRDIPARVKAMDIREIVVAIPSVSESRRQEILQELSSLDKVKIRVLPSTLDLLSRRPIRAQMRDIQIEDLLGREPIQLNPAPVDTFLGGKTVMVTGGGGSIGSELCRQIVKHAPRRLVIVDIYENNAYDIQQELLYKYGGRLDLSVEIASIRDRERLRQLFAHYRPDVVFHAAAHKHVPLMEQSPQEAVRNNVFGTLNVINQSIESGVEKFVLISTDKAVNPANIMGASKRIAEMLIQNIGKRSKMKMAAVRFGNVLGSNGSVIPVFLKQIKDGGPITLTDRNIKRYFMTIPEAVRLVLQTGALAQSGEVFVLDMGEPVYIYDLACDLIRINGLVPEKDVEIVVTGLRPGEKMFEELRYDKETTDETIHEGIFVTHLQDVDTAKFEKQLETLYKYSHAEDEENTIKAIFSVVPSTYRNMALEEQIKTKDFIEQGVRGGA